MMRRKDMPMPAEGGLRDTTTGFVKQKIKLFSLVVMFINLVFFLFVVRFTYTFLDYLPVRAMVFILAFSSFLSASMLLLGKAVMTRALTAIDDFSKKLNLLLEASKKIHEIGYSDVLIDNMMETAMSMSEAEGCSLILLEGDSLVFKKVKGGKSSELTGKTIPREKGVAGWVVATGVPVRISDTVRDKRFYPGIDASTGYETQSILCVPLKTAREVIGAIEVVNKRAGAFTSEDEALITYFAGHAARSLETAKFADDEKNYEIHFTGILIEAIDNIVAAKRGHSKRVAKYALILADAAGLPEDSKARLYRACVLHDIGFLRLLPKELQSLEGYRRHPVLARQMLGQINFYSDIVPVIYSHHERYDGKGYPQGLSGEAIPMEARIIAIAEAFDVMVSPHSYKNLDDKMLNTEVIPGIINFDKAVEELRINAGTQFDPKLVDYFVKNIAIDDVEPEA